MSANELDKEGVNKRLRPRKPSVAVSSRSSSRSSRRTDGYGAEHKPNISHSSSTDLQTFSESDKSQSSSNFDFFCLYCDKKFPSRKSLSKHTSRGHSSETESQGCLFCPHRERERTALALHMVEAHSTQYFACLHCHIRFLSTDDLIAHKFTDFCKLKRIEQNTRNRIRKRKGKKKIDKKQHESVPGNTFSQNNSDFNGVVISCELKPHQIEDPTDIEENITTNLIVPTTNKNIVSSNLGPDKNSLFVLDDIQWSKRMASNFSFHKSDTDQILSRLGVVHRSPRAADAARSATYKYVEDTTKFEKCFDTTFYSKVASNVQENLDKFLDGSFNRIPLDPDSIIKTRKSRNVINTAEGFPILLASEQYSRNVFGPYLPRSIAPKHKWKRDSIDNEKHVMSPDQVKRDSHANNCIITLVSGLDIWTQLCMRRKFDNKFNNTYINEKKTEKQNVISNELKEILESREIPSRAPIVQKQEKSTVQISEGLEFPLSLGLQPSTPNVEAVVPAAVLSGEWVRPRCYVCCACGENTRDPKALTNHLNSQHPHAQVPYYDIASELLSTDDSILKHLYVPPNQTPNRTRPLRGIKDCTKCEKPITLEDLHQHMLECAGDTPLVRRKIRNRPFGVRRRKPRMPDNDLRKQMRTRIRARKLRQNSRIRSRTRVRSEVGDAESIRKMIADLPAKRHRINVGSDSQLSHKSRKRESRKRESRRRESRKREIARKRMLRSRDSSDNSQSTSSTATVKEREMRKAPKNDDADIKQPLNARPPRIASRILRRNDFKRKIVSNLRRSPRSASQSDQTPNGNKRMLKKKVHTISSSVQTDEVSIQGTSEKIDVKKSKFTSREHSSRSNSSSNSNSATPSKSNSQEQSQSSNCNQPPQNLQLKHSIARLTSPTEYKPRPPQYYIQPALTQESFKAYEMYTQSRLLFENDIAAAKLDKPPLISFTHASNVDAYALQKSKLNKPRKKLNDCIAMLKNKLVEPTPPQSPQYQNVYETAYPEIPEIQSNLSYEAISNVTAGVSPIESGNYSRASSIPPTHTITNFEPIISTPLDLSGKKYSTIAPVANHDETLDLSHKYMQQQPDEDLIVDLCIKPFKEAATLNLPFRRNKIGPNITHNVENFIDLRPKEPRPACYPPSYYRDVTDISAKDLHVSNYVYPPGLSAKECNVAPCCNSYDLSKNDCINLEKPLMRKSQIITVEQEKGPLITKGTIYSTKSTSTIVDQNIIPRSSNARSKAPQTFNYTRAPETSNAVPSAIATAIGNSNNDPRLKFDEAKRIALLPKEIVEILGKMPTDHRNELLDVLPQYLGYNEPVKQLQSATNTKPQVIVPTITEPTLRSTNTEIATQTPMSNLNTTISKMNCDVQQPTIAIVDKYPEKIEKDVFNKNTKPTGEVVPQKPSPIKQIERETPSLETLGSGTSTSYSTEKPKDIKEKTASSLRAVRIKSSSHRRNTLNVPTPLVLDINPVLNPTSDGFSGSTIIQQAEVTSTQHSNQSVKYHGPSLDQAKYSTLNTTKALTSKIDKEEMSQLNTAHSDTTTVKQPMPEKDKSTFDDTKYIATESEEIQMKSRETFNTLVDIEKIEPDKKVNKESVDGAKSEPLEQAEQEPVNTADGKTSLPCEIVVPTSEGDSEDDLSLAVIVKQKMTVQVNPQTYDISTPKLKKPGKKNKGSKKKEKRSKNKNDTNDNDVSTNANITKDIMASNILGNNCETKEFLDSDDAKTENARKFENLIEFSDKLEITAITSDKQIPNKNSESVNISVDCSGIQNNPETVSIASEYAVSIENTKTIPESKNKQKRAKKEKSNFNELTLSNNKDLLRSNTEITQPAREPFPKSNADEMKEQSDEIFGTQNRTRMRKPSNRVNILDDSKFLDLLQAKNTAELRSSVRRSKRGRSDYLESERINDCQDQNIDKLPYTKKKLIFSKLLDEERKHIEDLKNIRLDHQERALQVDATNIKETSPESIIETKGKKRKQSTKKNKESRRKNITFSDTDANYLNFEAFGGTTNRPDIAELSDSQSKLSDIDLNTVPKSAMLGNIHGEFDSFDKKTNKEDNNIHVDKTENLENSTNIKNVSNLHEKRKKNKKPKKQLLEKHALDVQGDLAEYQIVKNEYIKDTNSEKNIKEFSSESKKVSTCYNKSRAVTRNPKQVSLNVEIEDHYDPYDIDQEDKLLEKLEPIRKRSLKTTLPKCNKKKSKPIKKTSNNNIDLKVTKDNSKIIHTDSDDSSKSDIPLKKLVDERIQKNNDKRKKRKLEYNDESLSEVTKSQSSNKCDTNDVTLIDTTVDELQSDKFMASFGFFSERRPRRSNLLASKKISETFRDDRDDVCVTTKEKSSKKADRRKSVTNVPMGSNETKLINDEMVANNQAPEDVVVHETDVVKITEVENISDNPKIEDITHATDKGSEPEKGNVDEGAGEADVDNMADETNEVELAYMANVSYMASPTHLANTDIPLKCSIYCTSKTSKTVIKQEIPLTEIAFCYCSLCEKAFRRPDNFVRHQLSLFHVSRLLRREMNIDVELIPEVPNCLIILRQHLERIKRLTDKIKKKNKLLGITDPPPKFELPSIPEIIAEAKQHLHSVQERERRGLSRDEELFLDCCELLKESHKGETVETVTTVDGENPPQDSANQSNTDGKFDPKSDEDVDSLTAKTILESEEVRNLEYDLLTGLKEAAEKRNQEINNQMQTPGSQSLDNNNIDNQGPERMPIHEDSKMKNIVSNNNKIDEHASVSKTSDYVDTQINKPEKEKKYKKTKTKITEPFDIDIYEDKFDKIKRKCRSQAAAAKTLQECVDHNEKSKAKKSEKKKNKKIRKNAKQNAVLTKGALKGFECVKNTESTSVTTDINPPVHEAAYDKSTSPKRKKSSSRKKKEKHHKRKLEGHGSQPYPRKRADIYEFMDNDDSDNMQFRTKKTKDHFKSFKDIPSTSRVDVVPPPYDMSGSGSDVDDFVYMSDDYLCSADETENSVLSCELSGETKNANESKKSIKRKEAQEKHAVMGKIFKNNSVKGDKKTLKDKESNNSSRANLDQLFDSLLEDEPNSSMLRDDTDVSVSKPLDLPIITTDSQSGDDSIFSSPHGASIKRKRSDDNKKGKQKKVKYSEVETESPMNGAGGQGSLYAELLEEAGVARQRAQRKCAAGKQNVLVESWSSESETDVPRSHGSLSAAPPRKKRSKKNTQSAARQARHVSFKNPEKEVKASKIEEDRVDGVGSRSRSRSKVAHCYSSEEEGQREQQHGWIVGPSHKKLVTMLAHSKERQRDDDDPSLIE